MKKKTTKTTKTPKTKLQKSGRSLRFSFEPATGSDEERLSTESLTEGLRTKMGTTGVLEKSVKPLKVSREVRKKVQESKVAFGVRNYRTSTDNVEQKGYQRLSDSELKQLAQLDPYVSAIIATRCSQAAACGNPTESKFKKGLRIVELHPLDRAKFKNDEEFIAELTSRSAKMKAVEQWVLSCGTSDREILDSAFAFADRTFKYCSLRQFIEAQVRNLLTFGRLATQVMRDTNGTPVMFRPTPVETISPVIEREDVDLTRRDEVMRSSLADAADYNAMHELERPAAWVQRIDGQNVNFFTEDDLKVAYYQKQALFELNGYPMAPLEMAVFMVFIHQQTLGYLRNQFVKGMATKGLINLQSTNENVQLSDADVEDFKQQFHNFVTRTDNSAVTPVIAGPVKVDWVQLAAGPKDMEFLQVEEHVIRALCSAYQISPMEMGYGHLSLPQGGITQGNKQEDIIRGEERGLRNLLDIVFDQINEIVFENFPEAKGLFKISYVGVGEDTRDAVVQRQTVEINTTATLASLYADSEKKDVIPIGGNVPLAPIFHQNVVRYLKYWEFRYYYLGDKEAKDKPEYDFIIDPNLNTSYQGLKVQPMEMQQEQAKMGMEQQKAQTEQVVSQTQMMEEQMQQGGEPGQEGGAQGADPTGGAQPPQPAQDDEAQKSLKGPSLKQMWLAKSSRQQAEKARISEYFRGWLEAHDYPLPAE